MSDLPFVDWNVDQSDDGEDIADALHALFPVAPETDAEHGVNTEDEQC